MPFLERIGRLSPVIQVRAGALLAILLAVYGGYLSGHQAYLDAEQRRGAQLTQHRQYLAILQRVMRTKAEMLSTPRLDEKNTLPFTPVDFQRAGARLTGWQPTDAGGEMSLETPWQSVPSTFPLLAERGMQVTAFVLMAHNDALRLTLQLVRDDES